MGRPNKHGLPEGLRKGKKGYFLDLYVPDEGGRRRRVREKIGEVPLAAAKRILAKRRTEIAEDRFLDRKQKPTRTFAEAADAFMDYSKQRRKSWSRDEQLLRQLRAWFGDRVLATIGEDEVYAYIASRRQDETRYGRPPSAATINRELSNLKTIFNREHRAGAIERNPLRGFKLLAEHNVRDRVLDADERQRLMDEAPAYLRPILELAYRTGMRSDEVVSLRWDRVDLRAGAIKLRSEDTKTGRARVVPLDSEMVAMLRAMPRSIVDDRVFLRNGKPIKSFRTAFEGACARAGIEDFRFHDLRHCAVTMMARLGIPEKTIMKITGHKTPHMLRRYQRVDDSDLRNAAETIRRFLGTPPNPADSERAEGR